MRHDPAGQAAATRRVGPADGSAPAGNSLQSDVFIRIGGPIAGKAAVSMPIDGIDATGDHSWFWRGPSLGWTYD